MSSKLLILVISYNPLILIMELIFLPDVSEQLDVAVAEGRGGPATPSVPAAGQGVGGT